ncbi:MAG: glycine/betaine ABC transporter substrate-binding protein, partial [Pseudomonadota bacterium]
MPAIRTLALGTALALVLPAIAAADCEEISFSDVGWTDITATTAAATAVLEAIGYETD